MAKLSRRMLLSSAVATSATLLGRMDARGRTIQGEVPWEPGSEGTAIPSGGAAGHFFTAEEKKFVEAAVDRLIPADELGPGALAAEVPTFIDRQLAGPYGQAETWYMQGPWKEGAATQGYQSRLTPAQLYRIAIKAINGHCRDHYGGKSFSELSGSKRDSVLKQIEQGDMTLEGLNAKSFFVAFLQNTVEGFFSDPLYGGNRDMIGWKLIGFPGARYDYRPYVKKHNQKLDLPPVGLTGRPGWTPKS